MGNRGREKACSSLLRKPIAALAYAVAAYDTVRMRMMDELRSNEIVDFDVPINDKLDRDVAVVQVTIRRLILPPRAGHLRRPVKRKVATFPAGNQESVRLGLEGRLLNEITITFGY
jgi:hypothetical protein